MKRSNMSLLGPMAIVVAAFIIGCDQDGSTSAVTISPEVKYLNANVVYSVTFTASGGDGNYTWSESSSSLGTLHAAGGTALYQSARAAGTNTLTVVDASGNIGSANVIQAE